MTIERFQFGRPGKLNGELEAGLSQWLGAAASLAPELWVKTIPNKLTLTPGECLAGPSGEALASLPDSCVALRLTLDGDIPSILALPRTLVLALVAALLGDAGGDPVTDRELTPVEDTLFAYFLEAFLLPALRETWPGAEIPELEIGEQEPYPQWSRIFSGHDVIIDCVLTFSGTFGEERARWLLPKKMLARLFGGPAAEAEVNKPRLAEPEKGLAVLIQDLPVEISVELGTASISLSQLASLRVGDVVILRQQVAAPLSAYVGEEKKLHVWAGRVGAWRAVQVESVLESA